MHSSLPSIGILIPTFQAAKHLPYCLPPLLEPSLNPRLLLLDSSSTDKTAEIAESFGAEVKIIPKEEFNHGATREKGRQLLGTEILVLLTQDAYVQPGALAKMISPIILGEASISYARQIPHSGAGFFESFPRKFNYPEESELRCLADAEKYGSSTFFCSNSCAAYRNAALDEIGGFEPVLFGEDTLAAAKLLHKGHRIFYAADAIVSHSHSYTLMQEFRRHFDIGLSRVMQKDLLFFAGGDGRRGKLYVQAMLAELFRSKPASVPYAILQTAMKWIGYKAGSKSLHAPLWIKKMFSSQKSYWQ